MEKLLEENEIIKQSNEIFQMLLKSYLQKDKNFKNNRIKIFDGGDGIKILIENKMKDEKNFVLRETLLNLF